METDDPNPSPPPEGTGLTTPAPTDADAGSATSGALRRFEAECVAELNRRAQGVFAPNEFDVGHLEQYPEVRITRPDSHPP